MLNNRLIAKCKSGKIVHRSQASGKKRCQNSRSFAGLKPFNFKIRKLKLFCCFYDLKKEVGYHALGRLQVDWVLKLEDIKIFLDHPGLVSIVHQV